MDSYIYLEPSTSRSSLKALYETDVRGIKWERKKLEWILEEEAERKEGEARAA